MFSCRLLIPKILSFYSTYKHKNISELDITLFFLTDFTMVDLALQLIFLKQYRVTRTLKNISMIQCFSVQQRKYQVTLVITRDSLSLHKVI